MSTYQVKRACPFCGYHWRVSVNGEPSPGGAYTVYQARCDACGAMGSKSESLAGALAKWETSIKRGQDERNHAR